MTDLFRLGLAQAAARIAAGDITAEALAASCAGRIRELEPDVRAWAWYDEHAMTESVRARAPAVRGPKREALRLDGVPVGIKDIVDVAGMPTGMGSPVYADHWPRASAGLVTRLLRSGAVPAGKTVTTEFAFMVPAKTRNPWNLGHTPGGSSSGSAAAVACGMVPAAVGTQTNGSVIRPAAFCGVVGFKPGRGRISVAGVLPFSGTLDQPGVFARSVADAALAASWMAEPGSALPAVVAAPKSAPKLLAVRTPVWPKAEAAMRDRFSADLSRLRAAGARVDERELPAVFGDAHRVHRTIMLYEASRGARAIRQSHRAQFSDFLNSALDEGERIEDAGYRQALAEREALIREFEAFLGSEADAVVTPPAPGEAPAGLDATGDPAFCTLWTLLGVPAITVPSGTGPAGLPLGLQIVARTADDRTLLRVAAWCEARFAFADWLSRA